MMWPMVRETLFRLDAETAHGAALRAAALTPPWIARQLWGPPPASAERWIGGIPFRGPVGLAAGCDKDGRAIRFWESIGFGFVELGTVTPRPYEGNPRPRVFRYPQHRAVINRMGLPNGGSLALARRLTLLRDAGWIPRVPIGVNVGKHPDTPLPDAPYDFTASIVRLRGLVDWFTINLSCPNTGERELLQSLDATRQIVGRSLDAALGTAVFVKLSPDLPPEALERTVAECCRIGAAGFVMGNTTTSRPQPGPPLNGEQGGLSGEPLYQTARHKAWIAIRAAGNRPVIAAGGIETAVQVSSLLRLGCAAVQLYTALVFHGPGLPSRINRALGPNPWEAHHADR